MSDYTAFLQLRMIFPDRHELKACDASWREGPIIARCYVGAHSVDYNWPWWTPWNPWRDEHVTTVNRIVA